MESTLNVGTEFTVKLPVRHVSETVAEADRTIACEDAGAELDNIESDFTFDDNKPLVLIIDDNRDIQKLVGELLASDYNIIAAPNGREGVRLAARYVPDLIICDVMMPVMDGLECCRRIKEEVSTSHIPVLMLTACSLDEQRVEGYESGADGYLPKPFNSSVLKSRCASLIANRKRIKDLWQSGPFPVTSDRRPKAIESLGTTDVDSDFYRRFLDILMKEIGNQDLNVDMIASKMGLERSQFYRKIKSLTNYAPVELIRRLRLQRGRELLLTTDRTVAEIAYETGFSTPAYFTKCYRDAYGETPSQARANLAK